MWIKTVGRVLFTALVGAPAIHASNATQVTDNHSRIVGGVDAEIGRYPFFVEWEGCGASLIHKGKLLFVQIAMLTAIDTHANSVLMSCHLRYHSVGCPLRWNRVGHSLCRLVPNVRNRGGGRTWRETSHQAATDSPIVPSRHCRPRLPCHAIGLAS